MPASVILPSPSAAFNILILSMSGFFMIMALRAMKAKASDRSSARSHAIKGFGLGLLFFIFQLYLLLKVRSMGLTMDGSLFGACFNLMIGAHLLHVLAGLAVMAKIIFNPKVTYASFKAFVLFWTFLVLVWPVLYVQLYR
jgi:heme/copper-type cytochrome/quinol oxidase subunit 3